VEKLPGGGEAGGPPSRASTRKVTGRLMSQDRKKRNSFPVISAWSLAVDRAGLRLERTRGPDWRPWRHRSPRPGHERGVSA
jgi:hypothetical protein